MVRAKHIVCVGEKNLEEHKVQLDSGKKIHPIKQPRFYPVAGPVGNARMQQRPAARQELH